MFKKVSLPLLLLVSLFIFALACLADDPWVVFEPKSEEDNGRHIVLLTGDEEYRSEEGLPMLAKILSQRHGFRCTVLFSVDAEGFINPDLTSSVAQPEALDSADAIVMLLRFRDWSDADMKHFVEAYRRGVPIIALRTSTHAFRLPDTSVYADFSEFGERVLGENWVAHWGRHKQEATRGIADSAAKGHPILRGVEDVFGDADVYEAYPPADATVLMRGQVLVGMRPTDLPASRVKKRSSDGREQPVNDPMMPVAWTREIKNEAGNVNRVFTTTMGAATDLRSEGLRRLVVNALFWGLNMEVPEEADVACVGEYEPTKFGFGDYRKGVRPSDHALDFSRDEGAKRVEEGWPLRLGKGAHIAVLGNAFADRMQHAGYLETLIHAYYPEHELVFRNLSAAGDEVGTWFRAEGFGSRDDWLERVQADLIFAFYGFNESTGGPESIDRFKENLEAFLQETKRRSYAGQGAPRVVLFSPLANERHFNPHIPEPASNNRNIAAYTEAMKEVAEADGLLFINLFDASPALFAAAGEGESLTTNGLYLKDEGYRLLAPVIFRALFGAGPPSGNLEPLRATVVEKNWQWHQRYRVIDGNNVYGGRSVLAYKPGEPGFVHDVDAPAPYLTNYRVMQEEMTQREVMTANRDRRIWALAKGDDLIIDDSNLPPVTPVPTNKPGPGPNQSHIVAGGEAAIGQMTIHPGLKVNLFADEKQFPELVNPVQIAWDTRGRLWVAVWPEYPGRSPTSTVGDSLLVFEDTDGDGRADRMVPFATDLNAPTGFQFFQDGVLVMQAPDLWFLRDTDGDGKADWKERVLMGMDAADSHHAANSLAYDPGGAIYLSDGVFHRTQVETLRGPVRNIDGAIYRFEPLSGHFETYISYNFMNPHGRVFDRWGNDLITDATGNHTYFGPAFSGRLDFEKGKHPEMETFWKRPSRPAAGTGLLTSRHFPEEFQNNFLNLNVISFRGIYRVKVSEEGAGLKGETLEPLLHSSDPNFIPSDIATGPDGAIYFSDWHNPIVGHMQHHLRDPSRDDRHGRIYRVTHEGRPLLSPHRIHGEPVARLLDLLKEPEDQVRRWAKIELAGRDSDEVIAGVQEWVRNLDTAHPEHEHQLLEALWVHQWLNVVDEDLLRRLLRSPEPRARAAAGRVLCYWRDRVTDALDLFLALAEDEDPRVRLEAVRGASFFREAKAVGVVLAAAERPTDDTIKYTMRETLRQLEVERLSPLLDRMAEAGAAASDRQGGVGDVEAEPGGSGELKVRAVRGEMRYDTARLVVEAGKPFDLVFENSDVMPHNLVILTPGSRETVGSLTDRMLPDEVDAEGRSYVPNRPEVIAATGMVEGGEEERIRVQAIEEEGVYEFVCTFPGHWQVMWGELVVSRGGEGLEAGQER